MTAEAHGPEVNEVPRPERVTELIDTLLAPSFIRQRSC